MEKDDATGLPINLCAICKKEVVGYVDNPDVTYLCEECKSTNLLSNQDIDWLITLLNLDMTQHLILIDPKSKIFCDDVINRLRNQRRIMIESRQNMR